MAACMYSSILPCTHAYMHPPIHSYILPCRHAWAHSSFYACMHAFMYPYILLHTYACTYPSFHAHMHACNHPSFHACMHVCTHWSFHACVHAYVNTSIQMPTEHMINFTTHFSSGISQELLSLITWLNLQLKKGEGSIRLMVSSRTEERPLQSRNWWLNRKEEGEMDGVPT